MLFKRYLSFLLAAMVCLFATGVTAFAEDDFGDAGALGSPIDAASTQTGSPSSVAAVQAAPLGANEELWYEVHFDGAPTKNTDVRNLHAFDTAVGFVEQDGFDFVLGTSSGNSGSSTVGGGYITFGGASNATRTLRANAPLPITDTDSFRVEADFKTGKGAETRTLSIGTIEEPGLATASSGLNGASDPVVTVSYTFTSGTPTVAFTWSADVRLFAIRVIKVSAPSGPVETPWYELHFNGAPTLNTDVRNLHAFDTAVGFVEQDGFDFVLGTSSGNSGSSTVGGGYITFGGASNATRTLRANAPLPITDTDSFRVEADFKTGKGAETRTLSIGTIEEPGLATASSGLNGASDPVVTVSYTFTSGTPTVAFTWSGDVRLFAIRIIKISAGGGLTGPKIVSTGGEWFESAYVLWEPSEYENYNVYVKQADAADTAYKLVDRELVRGNRADILGLKGGVAYDIKVAGAHGTNWSAGTGYNQQVDVSADVVQVTPNSYDRDGVFDDPSRDTVGGYNADGTVPDNAVIVYVTQDTMDTVKATLGGTDYTGLGGIFRPGGDAQYWIPLQNDNLELKDDVVSVPIIVRFLGQVGNKLRDVDNPEDSSGIPANLNANRMLDVRRAQNITFEGVGPGATIYGWGIQLNLSRNIEVRNLLFDKPYEDAIAALASSANRGVSRYLWVHNNEFFPGQNQIPFGGDADKIAGDGASDFTNGTTNFTASYNIYHGTAKSMLMGSSTTESREGGFVGTVHHNWFNGSGSRTPRVRFGQVDVYNNYYQNVSEYGIGGAFKSNILAEGNYFENTKNPMIISGQGHALETYTGTSPVGGTGGDKLSNEGAGTIKLGVEANVMDSATAATYDPDYDSGAVAKAPQAVSPDGVVIDDTPWVFKDWDHGGHTVTTAEEAQTDVQAYAGTMEPDRSVIAPAPRNFNVGVLSDDTFLMTWIAEMQAVSYEIEWDQGSGAWEAITSLDTAITSFETTEQTAEEGKTYTFRIRSVNDGGKSPWAEAVVDYTVPATPAGLVVTPVLKGFALTWTADPKVASYRVEFYKNSETAPELTEVVVGAVTFTTNALSGDYTGAYTGRSTDTYRIEVYALNGNLASRIPATETGQTLIPPIHRDGIGKTLWQEDFESKTPGLIRGAEAGQWNFTVSSTFGSDKYPVGNIYTASDLPVEESPLSMVDADYVEFAHMPADPPGSRAPTALNGTTAAAGVGLRLIDRSNAAAAAGSYTNAAAIRFAYKLPEELTTGRVIVSLDFALYTDTTGNSARPIVLADAQGKEIFNVRKDNGSAPGAIKPYGPVSATWSHADIVIDLDAKKYDFYFNGTQTVAGAPYMNDEATGLGMIGGLTIQGQQSGNSGSQVSQVYDNLTVRIEGADPGAETFSVSFVSNGGSAVTAQTVTAGMAATQPANPTREGYTFAGWYSDSGLTAAYDFKTPVTTHITLYAKWTPNGNNGGGSSGGGTAYKPGMLTEGDEDIKVTVSGDRIGVGAQLIITPINPNTTGRNAFSLAVEDARDGGQLIGCYEVRLRGGYRPPLTLTFDVGPEYNGQVITILHYVGKKVETYTVTVRHGEATIEVDSLSPFALILAGITVPDDIVVDPPKTGGRETLTGFTLLGIAALCTFYSTMKRRKA